MEIALCQMDFLYTDAEACHFMDPVTYEQVSVPQFVEAGDRVDLIPRR